MGDFNTANGVDALRSNTTGIQNTAIGAEALRNNTSSSPPLARMGSGEHRHRSRCAL
jgi:hypothetical protein